MAKSEQMDKARIASAILYVLKRAEERGVPNLSKFQIMKLLYLIDVEYRKFLGKSFFTFATFSRWDRGPVLFEAYPVLDTLKQTGKVKVVIKKNPEYGHDRECHSLGNEKTKIALRVGEKIFLNSVIDSYVTLTQEQLRKIAYSTEPMRQAISKETGSQVVKQKLDMNSIKKIKIA